MDNLSNLVQGPERQHILKQVLDARTLEEIDTVSEQLRQWVRMHPEDVGIREAFEGLSLLRDIAEEQEAERTLASGSTGHTERVA